MLLRTSATHPIRVDFIPRGAHGRSGQLGMTFAPGKKGRGIDGKWDRDLTTDLGRLRKEYATDVLVSLLEEHELGKLHILSLPAATTAAGIALERFAIPDGGVPADAPRFAGLVNRVIAHVSSGKTVVLHCRGGVGRTGLDGWIARRGGLPRATEPLTVLPPLGGPRAWVGRGRSCRRC